MSEKADKRIFKSLNKYFGKKRLRTAVRKSQKILNKIAVVFLVFIAILFFTYNSVEAFRVQVLNFILTFEKEYTSLRLENVESGGNMIAGFSNTYAPTYIPEGYRIDNIMYMNNLKIIEYINDEENLISFYDSSQAGIANVDTENAEIVKFIKINDIEGLFVLKNSNTMFVKKKIKNIFFFT